MRTSLIWRDCYFKFLDIPVEWKSKDLDDIEGREDAFWVITNDKEVESEIVPNIKDSNHRTRIEKHFRPGLECAFLISRNGKIQYYPYLSIFQGCSFEKINASGTSIIFDTISQLKNI